MGRKPLDDIAKLELIRVRITPSERAELDTAAAAAGVPTSTWLRDLGLSAARELSSPKTTAPKKPPAKPKKTAKTKA